METANSVDDRSNKKEVYVQLMPSAEVKMFTATPSTTIRDLKILSEEKCGIPSDVLIFMHNAVVLDDSTALLEMSSSECLLLDLLIQPLWEKFIHTCFKGENGRTMARIHIKMNQLTPKARTFVAAFIAAHKGNSELFQSVIESFKKEVIFQTVGLSGRSLLHAAVLGGNISCVMTLIINGGWKLLYQADKQRETPLDMAQRMKKEGLVQILTKYNDMYIDRHWDNTKGDETMKRDGKRTQLPGDNNRQDVKLKGKRGLSTVEDAGRDILVPKPPTQGRPGQRLLQRRDTPLKLHGGQSETITTQSAPYTNSTKCEIILENDEKETSSNNSNERVDQIKLPVINVEGGESPIVSPRSLSLGVQERRGSLPRTMGRLRSPSSPIPHKKLLSASPQQLMQRPRSRTTQGEDERSDAQMVGNQRFPFNSASAPSSPLQTRKRQSMPVSALTRSTSPFGSRMSLRVDQGDPDSFARKLQSHLMGFDKTRETLPWNVWKKIREPGTEKIEESSGESSDDEDEDEEERIRKYQQMSGHRKSFEVWLNAKEDQIVKEQTQAETEAKRLAEQKALEEMERRMRAKTFDEWLKEKDGKVEENTEDDVTEAEREARRAQASFKYQQWMKKKDELALAREEKIRAEEQKKYEELKKKREEEQRARWLRKKAGKANSVPI